MSVSQGINRTCNTEIAVAEGAVAYIKRYTISEAAEILKCSPSALRSWEAAGKIPQPERVYLTNARVYSENQLAEIEKYIRQNFKSVDKYDNMRISPLDIEKIVSLVVERLTKEGQ